MSRSVPGAFQERPGARSVPGAPGTTGETRDGQVWRLRHRWGGDFGNIAMSDVDAVNVCVQRCPAGLSQRAPPGMFWSLFWGLQIWYFWRRFLDPFTGPRGQLLRGPVPGPTAFFCGPSGRQRGPGRGEGGGEGAGFEVQETGRFRMLKSDADPDEIQGSFSQWNTHLESLAARDYKPPGFSSLLTPFPSADF